MVFEIDVFWNVMYIILPIVAILLGIFIGRKSREEFRSQIMKYFFTFEVVVLVIYLLVAIWIMSYYKFDAISTTVTVIFLAFLIIVMISNRWQDKLLILSGILNLIVGILWYLFAFFLIIFLTGFGHAPQMPSKATLRLIWIIGALLTFLYSMKATTIFQKLRR